MLAKLIIEALRMYTMQVAHILNITLDEIKRLQRDFVREHEAIE